MTTTSLARPASAGIDGDARTRLVTGLQPTGRLHVGNYLGAVRPLLQLAAAASTQTLAFVADLHAMTAEHDPGRLRAQTRELAATLLACGLTDDTTLFVQSAVPAHTELAYLLECTAAYGEMTRMIQFKEKAGADRASARLSLLTYPALMAADILLYRADVVPVGEDQRQHLELTRDIAQRFNTRFAETFVVPEAAIPKVGAKIYDLQEPTKKMSKSAESPQGTLGVLEPPETIERKIKRAVTDTGTEVRYQPEVKPGVSNLLTILAIATGRSPDEVAAG